MSPTTPLNSPAPAAASSPEGQLLYTQLLRTGSFRMWKPAIALVAGIVLLFISISLVNYIGQQLMRVGGMDLSTESARTSAMQTWQGFLIANLMLASMIPVAMVTTRVVYKVRAGWVSSIAGSFRWGWALRAFALSLGISVVAQFIMNFARGDLAWNPGPSALAFFMVLLVTIPLQASGEEYFFRGLIGQNVAAWFRGPWMGALIAGVVSSTLFAAAHSLGSNGSEGSQNVWLWLGRFVSGAAAAWLVWRTGGLEAACATHAVNNMVVLSFGLAATSAEDMLGMTSISVPELLFGIGLIVVITIAVDRYAQRLGISRTTAHPVTN